LLFVSSYSYSQRGTIKVDKPEKKQSKVDTTQLSAISSNAVGLSEEVLFVEQMPDFPGGDSEFQIVQIAIKKH
jgi:hypothetical protein